MKLTLIEDWRRAHKLGSVQVSGAMAVIFGAGPALVGAWNQMPDDLKAALPQGWAHWIATAGFVLVLLARVMKFDRSPQGGGDGAQ